MVGGPLEAGRLQQEVVEQDTHDRGEHTQAGAPAVADEGDAQQVDGQDQGEAALARHQPGQARRGGQHQQGADHGAEVDATAVLGGQLVPVLQHHELGVEAPPLQLVRRGVAQARPGPAVPGAAQHQGLRPVPAAELREALGEGGRFDPLEGGPQPLGLLQPDLDLLRVLGRSARAPVHEGRDPGRRALPRQQEARLDEAQRVGLRAEGHKDGAAVGRRVHADTRVGGGHKKRIKSPGGGSGSPQQFCILPAGKLFTIRR